MRLKLLLHLTILISLGMSAGTTDCAAQIQPPLFQCVKGDTLFWQPAANPCGAFVSYQIYYSTSFGGPYSLLATVTDPTRLYYVHMGGGPIRYYYLRSDHNCPGEIQINSDTLDNFPPPKIPIEVVSTEAGGIEISWLANTAPQITGYIIYKATGSGTIPIDTLYGNLSTSFTDVSPPVNNPVFYYVLALDACGNTSQFDVPHNTIVIHGTSNTCARTNNLGWNLYQNWPEGIDSQEIYLSLNGGPETLIATLGPSDTTYAHGGLLKNNTYCYRISAIRQNSPYVAHSNIICIVPDIIQPMNELYLLNLTANAQNELELSWRWDSTAEIQSYTLEHNGQAFSNLNVTGTLSTYNQAISDLSASQAAQDHLVRTLDDCDSIFVSNTIRNAVLSGTSTSGGNRLSWTPFSISNGQVLRYDLYSAASGLIASLDPDSSSYFDPIAAGPLTISCYRLQTVFINELGALPDEQFVSLSNEFCVVPQVSLSFPNAFTPEGNNPVFKPVVTFKDVLQSYSLQIFDRWGGRLFESNDVNIGWDGRAGNDQVVPSGVYTYIAKAVQTNGRVVEKAGTVVVVK